MNEKRRVLLKKSWFREGLTRKLFLEVDLILNREIGNIFKKGRDSQETDGEKWRELGCDPPRNHEYLNFQFDPLQFSFPLMLLNHWLTMSKNFHWFCLSWDNKFLLMLSKRIFTLLISLFDGLIKQYTIAHTIPIGDLSDYSIRSYWWSVWDIHDVRGKITIIPFCTYYHWKKLRPTFCHCRLPEIAFCYSKWTYYQQNFHLDLFKYW